MKKFRGKRRYFRNLEMQEQVEEHDLDFGKDSWFDYWHTHLDWYGYGNDSMKIRRQHTKSFLRLLNNMDETLKKWDKPYQLWLWFSRNDAGSDALFIHSENPNKDNFPYKNTMQPKEIGRLPEFLEGLIDPNNYEIICYDVEVNELYGQDEADVQYIVRSLNSPVI